MANVAIQFGGGDVAPFIYTVPGAQPIRIQAISAYFDTFAAAGQILAVCDVYSASGRLISRTFAPTPIEVGDNAEVTFAPFLGLGAGASAASADDVYATSPQIIPVLAGEHGSNYGNNWGTVRVDNTVRMNAVRTNQSGSHTAAIGDYLTCMCTLGPRGSIWGIMVCYKVQPAGGRFKVSLGSVASPNPTREALDPTSYLPGSLYDDFPTWIDFGGYIDTYAPAALDVAQNVPVKVWRVMGEVGDPYTALTVGGDPFSGATTIDGGPGMYSLKLEVVGKDPASTGYRCELTFLALMRLTDVFNY